MSDVDVSVIVPARNAAATLADQLDALSRQAVDATWELLLCDNGSSDDTVRIARSYEDRIPRLRVIDVRHRMSAGSARNAGAQEAVGRSLLFCDADDAVADDWIAAHLAVLATSPVSIGEVDYDGLKRQGRPSLSWLSRGPLLFHLPALPQLVAFGAGNFGIRRDVYRQMGGFEERLTTAEDADLAWRLQLAGIELGRSTALCHVRPRQSLAAIARQAYDYGRVYRTLDRRYSRVRGELSAAATASASGVGVDAPEISVIAAQSARRVIPAVRYLRRLTDGRSRADVVWGVFHRLGQRVGKVEVLPVVGPDGRADDGRRRASAAPGQARDTWASPPSWWDRDRPGSLLRVVRADWRANGVTGALDLLKPAVRFFAVYRFGQWALDHPSRRLAAKVYWLLFARVRNRLGIEIVATATLGRDVRIEHQHGIVVHPFALIGDRVQIHHGVTIGLKSEAELADIRSHVPRIGSDVVLGVGATVIGAVVVGDGARIGPHAVVSRDVAPGATVVAAPSKVFRREDEA